MVPHSVLPPSPVVPSPRHFGRLLHRIGVLGALLFGVLGAVVAQAEDRLAWRLAYQTPTSEGSGRYHRLQRDEQWEPARTALIVCDMWDSHHSQRAVQRVEELAPRLNEVIAAARQRGVTIIHAPSSCMDAYQDHPARKRAVAVTPASSFPDQISDWCHQIPAEEKGVYPVDQSNGGEDDDPLAHDAWLAELAAQGRQPRSPWQRQHAAIVIDGQRDYISDQGKEVWSILQAHGIRNVILAGVHTNMCVLGRPFGLRRMVQAGMNTVLLRDMTDTMYEPGSRPFVSHFTGTDLIIDHIERHVCPTISSEQLVGGKPFRFAQDQRPTVAIVMAEDEYKTEQTLPAWALAHLGHPCRVRLVFGSDTSLNDIPGIEAVADADLLIVSARRRTLPAMQLAFVREFVAAGKPVVGVRTANHGFSTRQGEPVAGTVAWPEFDAQVFGGQYAGHHGNEITPTHRVAADATLHPILRGFGSEPFTSGGSLYRVMPIAAGATPLLFGEIEKTPAEPSAWTFRRADGGWSFYTSLGHVSDFENPRFQRMLANAVLWLLENREPASGR